MSFWKRAIVFAFWTINRYAACYVLIMFYIIIIIIPGKTREPVN